MNGKSRIDYRWRIANWLTTNIFTSMPKHDVKIHVIVDSRNSECSAGRYLQCQLRKQA